MSNRYAIIKDGIVVNVVVADAQIASANEWIECPIGGVNWTYADGVFTAPVVVETPAPVPLTKEMLIQVKWKQLQ